jgi:hypothetical protein
MPSARESTEESKVPIGDTVNLVNDWIGHFWAADRSLKWIAAEVEHSVWLTPNILLVGRMDTLGENENGLFFGEWKTANPRERNSWKQVWRMNPQSLTYGVLANDWFVINQGRTCSQFTVRKAFKSTPPTFDHAWFSYNDAELEHWRGELINIAAEIRGYQGMDAGRSWPTNWEHCFKYGPNYACPHFEQGCSKMVWAIDPATPRRVSHLEIERRLNETEKYDYGDGPQSTCTVWKAPERSIAGLVILDATRVKTWLGCRERFRREYVENVATPVGEALEIGIAFHDAVGRHYTELVQQQGGNK